MKKFSNFALFLCICSAIVIIVGCTVFNYMTGPVSNDKTSINFIVNTNSTYLSIAPQLKSAGLIKSEYGYKLCVKLFNPTLLKTGLYKLNKTMSVKDIIAVLEEGKGLNPNVVLITFKEGLNMRAVAKLIATKTSNTEQDVFDTLKDQTYLDSLMPQYWFLTPEIKNPNIYYSLEGYLFPDTYEFLKTSNVKDIFKIILNNTNKKLTPYKTEIEASKYSIHELITLASIIELEASNSNNRAGVAGVFYNRLKDNWTLGSDVTTYYAVKKDFSYELTYADTHACNVYNTRGTCFNGLPVGPICNPGIESLIATIEPEINSYYYFVADKNGKTYFNKTEAAHSATVTDLINKGLWHQYKN